MLSLLTHPVFGRLLAAQVVALLGTGLLTVALGLLAFDLAGARAGVVLGIAYSVKMLAYVVLSPIIQALVADLPRRAVLVCADIVRGLVALCLPFVTEIWQIYALIFVLQTASATFTPVFQALIPAVLTDEARYTRALSLSRLAYDLENLTSPALAGLLLGIVNYSWLFTGTALGFALSAILVLGTVLPAQIATKQAPFMARVTRGTRIYLATPRLRGLLALVLGAAAGSAFVLVNTVVLVRSGYAGSEGDLALAMAAFGAGSMAAALGLPRLLDTLPDRIVMLVAGAGLAGVMMLSALWLGFGPPAWPAFLMLWLLTGALYSAVQTPSGRLLRRSAPEADRAAIFAAHFALSHACWLVTYPLAGLLGVALGLPVTLGILAVIAAFGVLLAIRLWPASDGVQVPHSHPDLPKDHPHLAAHSSAHSHALLYDDLHPRWPAPG